jgi:hypothetical protein
MHLFVAQQNWTEPVLKAAVVVGNHTIGVYDCVTRSICAYANPAPAAGDR